MRIKESALINTRAAASREEKNFPGAVLILKGAVPASTPGFWHTAPTC